MRVAGSGFAHNTQTLSSLGAVLPADYATSRDHWATGCSRSTTMRNRTRFPEDQSDCASINALAPNRGPKIPRNAGGGHTNSGSNSSQTVAWTCNFIASSNARMAKQADSPTVERRHNRLVDRSIGRTAGTIKLDSSTARQVYWSPGRTLGWPDKPTGPLWRGGAISRRIWVCGFDGFAT